MAPLQERQCRFARAPEVESHSNRGRRRGGLWKWPRAGLSKVVRMSMEHVGGEERQAWTTLGVADISRGFSLRPS